MKYFIDTHDKAKGSFPAQVLTEEQFFAQFDALEKAGEEFRVIDVIRAAARDVERPIFYSIAVIIAAYLPIYVLTGASGRLFRPMADTMSFALVGSLVCTLTLLPVLCAFVWIAPRHAGSS